MAAASLAGTPEFEVTPLPPSFCPPPRESRDATAVYDEAAALWPLLLLLLPRHEEEFRIRSARVHEKKTKTRARGEDENQEFGPSILAESIEVRE